MRIFRIVAGMLCGCAVAVGAEEAKVKVDDDSFRCISEMTPVRHFYVDNLLGDLDATLEVANAGSGTYPEGSLVMLVPFEAMVKQQKGFNPATKDWEFFSLEVTQDGAKILKRGFADVTNAFGGNCFGCHVRARPEFDLICEQGQGCEEIPITRPMLGALQRTDPRCEDHDVVSTEDSQALKDLEEAIKILTQNQ